MKLLKFIFGVAAAICIYGILGISFVRFLCSDASRKVYRFFADLKDRLVAAVKVFKEPENNPVLYGYPSIEAFEKERNNNLNVIRTWAQDKRKNGHTISFEMKEGKTNQIYLKYDGTRYEAEVVFREEYGAQYIDYIKATAYSGAVLTIEGNIPNKPKLDIDHFFANEETQKYCRSIAETVNDFGEAMFSIYICAGCETYEELISTYTEEEVAGIKARIAKNYDIFEELSDGLYICRGYKEE